MSTVLNALQVNAFKASKYLVSNQEFLEFVKVGGYRDDKYWTDEGRNWRHYTKTEMPRFWVKHGEIYYQRNMLEEIELPLNWPVEVNYLEANAFCNWKARSTGRFIRLPTEAEWYVLRQFIDNDQPDWVEAPGNINLEHFASPCPVDQFEVDGFFDIVGNVGSGPKRRLTDFRALRCTNCTMIFLPRLLMVDTIYSRVVRGYLPATRRLKMPGTHSGGISFSMWDSGMWKVSHLNCL